MELCTWICGYAFLSYTMFKALGYPDVLQDRSSSSELLRLTSRNEVMTSIEGPQLGTDPYLMCFTTTDKVVWVDSRYTRTSVLSWDHHREHDQTLTGTTISCDEGGLKQIVAIPLS